MQGPIEFLGTGVINDVLLNPVTATDVTAFLNSKHVEVRTFWNYYRGGNALDVNYIGQSLVPGDYSLTVVDGEAQYIDQFKFGDSVDNDLHVGGSYRLKYVYWSYLANNETENHAGFFVHDEAKFGKRFAIVADYRADYVPYLDRIVQSPRASVLFHPTKQSTIRGIVGTAFRTPTFLESYLGLPLQLPLAGASAIVQGQRSDNPNFKLNPEEVFTAEIGYLNQDSDFFTIDSAFFYNHVNNLIDLSPLGAITVGDLNNPNVPTGPSTQTGLYPAFLGGWENECQDFNVLGAEIGLRTFPVEGLDVYANTTLMDVKQNNSGCTAAQLSLLANDARTSAVKVNGGIQLRTKIGIDGSVDFHYVSEQTWAEQIQDVQKQRIDYQSFSLPSYELLNASVGYRFLKNQAEIRGVGFNLLNDQHREHPFGQWVDRRLMALFSYKF
jgi:iron complex outermembrane receptor protein